MKKLDSTDLGFSYKIRKNGEVSITRKGQIILTLRRERALDFREEMGELDFAAQQQLLARITGNYKRGNERRSKNHPRKI